VEKEPKLCWSPRIKFSRTVVTTPNERGKKKEGGELRKKRIWVKKKEGGV